MIKRWFNFFTKLFEKERKINTPEREALRHFIKVGIYSGKIKKVV